MRIAFAAALLCMIGTACAQEGDAPPTLPIQPPEETVKAPDPQEVKQAQDVLAEVARTYKDAKTITDTMKVKFKLPGMPGIAEPQEQEQEVNVAIGTGADATMGMQGFKLIAVDGKLHFLADNVPDKYFAAPLEKDLGQTLATMFGDSLPPPPHFVLRGEGTPEQKLGGLTMGMMGNVDLSGYKLSKAEDGSTTHEVSFRAARGKGTAHIAGDSKLVRRVTMEFEPQPGMTVNVEVAMDPKIADALATPITFNAGDRKLVASLDELQPTPIKVGDAAPDFTLTTLDGESVTLSKLQGSVVVLDFWATWCGPCKRALPMLQEFADSAPTVKVYAVNVWERTKSATERKTKVSEFWKTSKYTMPTLLDLDDSVISKYGFGGIPSTVIIGPDGKVKAIHNGLDPEVSLVDQLKKDVEEASKTAG